MKRIKRDKIKHEKPETSSAFTRAIEEHDLAYYIHDRVELMHQVFSVLKTKDIRAMAPESVRRLTIDDLQELCTEELLGISSKRLLAVLDGAEPPSDTESSSQSSEHLEAISLDSISSDEEILSQGNKKKRKHKRHDSTKSKKHRSKKSPTEPQTETEKSKASRAGLTVLELLELQARARAIRAQLQQEQAKRTTEAAQTTVGVDSSQSSDSDVEVKEEQPEVVEIISSDDEKPKIEVLENAITSAKKSPEKHVSNNMATAETEDKESSKKKKKKDKSKKKDKKQKESTARKDNDKSEESTVDRETDKSKDVAVETRKDSIATIDVDTAQTSSGVNQRVTKRVNDLIITVPQQSKRKIKLNRNKVTVSIAKNAENEVEVAESPRSIVSVVTKPDNPKKMSSVVKLTKNIESVVKTVNNTNATVKESQCKNKAKVAEKGKKEKTKRKVKKIQKRQSIDEDHDEITLQLSDSEKMDLLENFDKRNYDNVSSSSSDSESSSDSDDSGQTIDTSTELDKTNDKIEDTSNQTSLDIPPSIAENVTRDNGHFDVNEESVNEEKTDNCKNYNSAEPVSDKNNTKHDHAFEGMDDVKGNEDAENKSNVKEKEQNDAISEVLNDVKGNENEENRSIIKENKQCNLNQLNITSDADKNPKENVSVEEITKSCSPSKDSRPEEKDISNNKSTKNEQENVIEISEISDIPIQSDFDSKKEVPEKIAESSSKHLETEKSNGKGVDARQCEGDEETTTKKKGEEDSPKNKKELSEGELSENESSEVEALELQQEVVCISDEEAPLKKKKDKKSKKGKKKKSDFRVSSDQNFYKENKESGDQDIDKIVIKDEDIKNEPVILENDIDDDVYEILELSDDSSCYEVEGTILSKEPTVEEIAALSAKIDEIEREDVVTEQEILMHEKINAEKQKAAEEVSSNEEIENVSWKDRYLDSKKVKKVLTTSNILNALRKKNKELKKKMEESKREKELELQLQLQREKEEKAKAKIAAEERVLEEGSIEQYNTLETCTRYVDPVPDPIELAKKKEEELKEQEMKEAEFIKDKEREVGEAIEAQVTGEMKKDAKQLLKIYKKLLKYNDIKKQKDPNKKKSKKKKKKEKD